MDVDGEIFTDAQKNRFFAGVYPTWLHSGEINQFTPHLRCWTGSQKL